MQDIPAGFRKVNIEIIVPEDLDDSDLLEEIQEFSVNLAENAADDFEDVSLDFWEVIRTEASIVPTATE